MSRVKTWLVSDKKFLGYFRVFTRYLPNNCRNCLFSSSIATVNYSSYLSFISQKKNRENTARYFLSPQSLPLEPPSPKVPLPSGTFSFRDGNLQNQNYSKVVWLLEIEKIPPRHREGLIKLMQKFRQTVFLCSVFSPHSFSPGLAKESDFYFIKKKSWIPVAKQLKSVFLRVVARQTTVLDFPKKFTLKEKLAIRILWKLRHRFASVEEISSYIYGKRMSKNLHASEVIISELRKKLRNITGKNNVIKNIRSYGFRIEKEAWEELEKLK